ncbi:PREDICTED: uncharacterized protein LOC106742963 [Dinoponera quadriceps]|uniref:Small RNA 2'-O-methyltransferase n=1 Tax=Dinoponera quadriceps TaxID=609295 RepID=A0A6P3X0W2_DINQU|nr:PREDICTED: uncharacterized protein LOC106742963 [Dinoponera quadriceps]
MFLVVFQMLYLFGKYIYNNYRDRKAPSSDVAEGETANHVVNNDNRIQVEIDDAELLPLEISQIVKFSPPAYIQRYLAVANVLNDPKYGGKLRKVVDFGCSELGFLPYLKNLKGVEEIIFVDVDRNVLLLNKAKAMPLVSDHFQHRQRPLKIEICMGSVIHNDKKLEKTDAVVCIELIEHLYDHVLLTVPINIFQYIRPKVVVITTPNVEFNVLFPNLAGGFRHQDHKFEWTRRQFQSWAENIVRKYPYYCVKFQGICYGPEDTKHLGACTQMAIFERVQEPNIIGIEGVEGFFETIDTYIYPFTVDKRTDSRKVLDEVLYYVNFLAHENEESPNVVYLAKVKTLMKKYCISLEVLKDIMCEHGYIIEERENGLAVILPDESETDEMYVEVNSEYDGSTIGSDQLLDLLSSEDEQLVEDYSTNGDAEYENENWNNESIIILESQAVPKQENSYLFDGEHSADRYHPSEEMAAAPDIRFPRRNNTEGLIEQKVPRNATSSAVNDLVDNIATYNNSIKSGLLPVTLEDVDMNLSSVQDNDDAIFQSYLSISRSSTSPGLLFNPEMDDSLISQNLLNNTFNKSEITATTIGKPVENCSSIGTFFLEEKDFSDHSPSSSLEVNYSSNVELDDIQLSINRISKDCDSAETELQINFYDEPQSTSSPRKVHYINPSPKKVHATHSTKRSCLEGDDLITALESYTELNSPETPEQVVPDVLEGIDQEPLYVTETTDPFQATSDKKNATSKRETDCSSSNNSQRELRLENNVKSCGDQSTLVDSLQEDCNEEIAEKENLIKHETDDIVDVKRIEYRGSKVAAMKPHSDDTRLRNGKSEGLASVSGENLFQDFSNSKSWSSSDERSSSVCAKENNGLVDSFKSCDEEDVSNKIVQFASPPKSDTKDSTCKDVNTSSSTEAKPPSSPSFESPPDSWSHEIMDSGYPNSASGQDITPENDLSSIAQDHIADTEAPRLGVPEPVEVENGDLANNNRDDEGNNMMAADANDIEGLQPLIDVLENDLENENDIYVLENGFPMWLLRILDMANPLDFDVQPRRNLHREVADVHYMDHDEGFDSSSSDE